MPTSSICPPAAAWTCPSRRGSYDVEWVNAMNTTDRRSGGTTSTGAGLSAPNSNDWLVHLVPEGTGPEPDPTPDPTPIPEPTPEPSPSPTDPDNLVVNPGFESGDDSGARLEVQWRTNKGNISTVVIGADVTGTTDWVQRSELVVAPKNAVRARLNLYLAKESDDAGEAWFDELSLVPSN